MGYAFPTAPLFALGHLLLVPAWITERVWIAPFVTPASGSGPTRRSIRDRFAPDEADRRIGLHPVAYFYVPRWYTYCSDRSR